MPKSSQDLIDFLLKPFNWFQDWTRNKENKGFLSIAFMFPYLVYYTVCLFMSLPILVFFQIREAIQEARSSSTLSDQNTK